MNPARKRIEDAIEGLIEALDEIDGDFDLEDDPIEEQHDAEADLTWTTAPIPTFYVIAENARRRASQRR
jgi:hypothetical protein